MTLNLCSGAKIGQIENVDEYDVDFPDFPDFDEEANVLPVTNEKIVDVQIEDGAKMDSNKHVLKKSMDVTDDEVITDEYDVDFPDDVYPVYDDEFNDLPTYKEDVVQINDDLPRFLTTNLDWTKGPLVVGYMLGLIIIYLILVLANIFFPILILLTSLILSLKRPHPLTAFFAPLILFVILLRDLLKKPTKAFIQPIFPFMKPIFPFMKAIFTSQ